MPLRLPLQLDPAQLRAALIDMPQVVSGKFGGHAGDFCTSGQTLCGWNTERKTLVQLASWLDAGIHASALLGFTVDADGQILAAVQENGSAQLAMLIPGADRPETSPLPG